MIRNKIYFIVFSIIIYFILQYIYNNFIMNNNLKEVYILNKDVVRGYFLKNEDVSKIKISILDNKNYITSFKEGYLKYDLYKNQILLQESILEEKDYAEIKSNNELIAIKINQPEDVIGYQLKKDYIVNIYFSAKLSDMENILKLIPKESIISSDEGGYVTIRLLENVKIINVYDKIGNISDNVIDTIVFETDKDNTLKINNLKNYGKFSVSLIR